jgi:peptidyl-prolyl cis-trans isomerase D
MPRPAEGKPTSAMAALANDSYALVQLKGVHDGDPAKADQAGRDQVRQQLQQQNAGAVARAFIASLRKSTKIEIAEDRIP